MAIAASAVAGWWLLDGDGDVAADAPTDGPAGGNCVGNAVNGFCGRGLRVLNEAGGVEIGMMATGAHFGPTWQMPGSANNSTGVGFCVDDTHTGGPVAAVVEQPTPGIWSPSAEAQAAWILATFAGDRVSPYQNWPVNPATGELVVAEANAAVLGGTSATQLRMMAAHLALRSVLADPIGTPLVDPSSMWTQSLLGNPSPVGDAAMALAEMMVAESNPRFSHGAPVVQVSFVDGAAPTAVGAVEQVRVRLVDPVDGTALPGYPVHPINITNASVTPVVSGMPEHANATALGWPSLDATTSRAQATVTDWAGEATFTLEVGSAAPWSVEFATETAPSIVHLYSDNVSSQGNVSWLSSEILPARSGIDGDLTRFHFRIVKTVADATFEPVGQFAVIDGSGDVAASGWTNAAGVLDFAPVDPAQFEPPYRLRELTPPYGMEPLDGDVPFTGPPYSTNPEAPTVVEVSNHPVLARLEVQKVVTGSAGAPDDLSGFVFRVTRVADGAVFGELVTEIDGTTAVINVPSGTYDVEEIERPGWWPAQHPVTAFVTVVVPPAESRTVTVSGENVLPTPTMTTSASDQADGDRFVPVAGGTVVDRRRVCRHVAGTEYVTSGELMDISTGEPESTGIVGSVAFVGAPDDAGCELVDVAYTIPAGSVFADGGVGVVYADLALASTGEVIVREADPAAPTQTVWLPSLVSSARDGADGDQLLPPGGGVVVDTDTYCGLPPGSYELTAHLMELTADGGVAETGIVATEQLVVDGHCGSADVELTVPGDSVFADGGTGVVFVDIVQGDQVIVSHRDPGAAGQRVYVPAIGTLLAATGDGDAARFAGPSTELWDVVAYRGLPAGWYRADMTLHVRADGTCTATDTTASATFEATTPQGTVDVGPFTVPEVGSAYVAYEVIVPIDAPDEPGQPVPSTAPGTSAPPTSAPGGEADDRDDAMPIVGERDCGNADQTISAPRLASQVTHAAADSSGVQVDRLTVSGLSAPGADVVRAARIEVGLHRHDPDPGLGERTCTAANRVAEATVTVSGNGDYASPGEPYAHGSHSYSNRLVLDLADGTTFATEWIGCNEPAESFDVRAVEVDQLATVTTTIPGPTSPTPTRSYEIAATGGGGGPRRLAGLAGAAAAAATALLVRRRRRPDRSTIREG